MAFYVTTCIETTGLGCNTHHLKLHSSLKFSWYQDGLRYNCTNRNQSLIPSFLMQVGEKEGRGSQFHVSGTFKFWKSSGRCAFVSFVLLLISRFFLGLGLLWLIPCIWAMAFRRAVLVAGFIPFFWRSFSMSTMSRGSSIPRKSSFKSSSTFISGTLGSFGYAMSSWESRLDSSHI